MNSQSTNAAFTGFVTTKIGSNVIDHNFVNADFAPDADLLRRAERARQIECRKADDRVLEYWSVGMIALTVIATIASMIKMVM